MLYKIKRLKKLQNAKVGMKWPQKAKRVAGSYIVAKYSLSKFGIWPFNNMIREHS
jgi:hypothetical protein